VRVCVCACVRACVSCIDFNGEFMEEWVGAARVPLAE